MDIKFKILTGFGAEREISIDTDELDKAFGVFLGGGRAVFRNGAIDSKYIQGIVEDPHATMGWNKSHKLDTYDFQELRGKGLDRTFRDLLSESKKRVQISLNGKKLLID